MPTNHRPTRTPIVELGVAEAYAILLEHFGIADLAPLEAFENEDWGRDALLSRLLEFSVEDLADAGLIRDESGPGRPPITE